MFASVHGRARSWSASLRRAADALSFARMVLHVSSAFVTLSYACNWEVGWFCRSERYCLSDAVLASVESECAAAFISHSIRDRGSRNHQSPTYPLINRQCMLSDVDGRRCVLSDVQSNSHYMHLRMAHGYPSHEWCRVCCRCCGVLPCSCTRCAHDVNVSMRSRKHNSGQC